MISYKPCKEPSPWRRLGGSSWMKLKCRYLKKNPQSNHQIIWEHEAPYFCKLTSAPTLPIRETCHFRCSWCGSCTNIYNITKFYQTSGLHSKTEFTHKYFKLPRPENEPVLSLLTLLLLSSSVWRAPSPLMHSGGMWRILLNRRSLKCRSR